MSRKLSIEMNWLWKIAKMRRLQRIINNEILVLKYGSTLPKYTALLCLLKTAMALLTWINSYRKLYKQQNLSTIWLFTAVYFHWFTLTPPPLFPLIFNSFSLSIYFG